MLFIVANTKGPNLLGRDVLRLLWLNWEKLLNVYYVEENVRTENYLDYQTIRKFLNPKWVLQKVLKVN